MQLEARSQEPRPEAVASSRSGDPAASSAFGLDFFTAHLPRLTIRNDGRVGVGTQTPNDNLEVVAPDAAVRVKNSNDQGLGGFIENTYSALQLGMFSESSNVGQIAGGTKRALFGFNADGTVGSLVNDLTNPTAPAFRNVLDDGNGNMSVSENGSLSFGAKVRQMLNLWAGQYGIGVQSFTLYQRSDGNFAWYRGGTHNDGILSNGGGTTLMALDSAGNLTTAGTVNGSSDRHTKTNLAHLDARTVLAKVAALPILRWSYTNDLAVRHIGPMAQDFHAAFDVGTDDKHIAMVDADGVALAGIQGLHELVQAKARQIERLQRQNQTLEERLAVIERTLARLAIKSGLDHE